MIPGLDPLLLGAIAVALAFVVGPGIAVAAGLGVRGLALVALAGPLSVGLLGAAGVVLSAIAVPFTTLSFATFSGAVVAIAITLRLRLLRGHEWPTSPNRTGLVATIGASAIAAVFILAQLGRPDAISQSYDAVFHLNAAMSILSSGDASSFTLYAVSNPGEDIEFYPAAWHSLVALTAELTGSGIARATTGAWLAVATMTWIPGVVWLTDVSLGHRFPRRILAASSAVAAISFAAFPYGLLDFGTLYPTGLAYALIPSGLALVILIVGRALGTRSVLAQHARDRAWLRLGVLAGLWVTGGVFSHPRAMLGFALLAAPIVIFAGVEWARDRVRRPNGRRVVAIVVTSTVGCCLLGLAASLTAALVYFDVASRPLSDRLNGAPARADQSLGDAVLQVLGAGPVVRGDEALPPALGLAALMIAGLVLSARRVETAWIVVGFVTVAVLYVVASTSDSDLAKLLTAAWYKDKFRLSALLPVVAAPAAAAAVAHIWQWVGRGSVSASLRIAAIIAILAAVAGSSVSTAVGMAASLRSLFAVPESNKDGVLIDAEQWRLMSEQLPSIVPEGERVVGNPWNGSSLSWVLGAREPLFPHLVGRWDRDRRIIAYRLDEIHSDPEVCQALDRLDAHYVIHDPELLWNGNVQAEKFTGIDEAIELSGFELVAQSGSASLYRITACP